MSVKFGKLSGTGRVILLVSAMSVLLLFGLVWAGSRGWLSLGMIFGICGFKQRTGYPCPGCGITTAAVEFMSGNILEAFYIQPAGALLCVFGIGFVIFSLLAAIFGVDFGVLRRENAARIVKYVVISGIIILLSGWAVTMSRAIVQNRP